MLFWSRTPECVRKIAVLRKNRHFWTFLHISMNKFILSKLSEFLSNYFSRNYTQAFTDKFTNLPLSVIPN